MPRIGCSVPVFGVGGKCFLPRSLTESPNDVSSQREPEQLDVSLLFSRANSHQTSEEIRRALRGQVCDSSLDSIAHVARRVCHMQASPTEFAYSGFMRTDVT